MACKQDYLGLKASIRKEDWEGVREGGVKAKSFKSKEVGTRNNL